jgi:hypothetical protein
MCVRSPVPSGYLSYVQITMSVFELRLVSLPDGKFAATWFDDERFLWDDERLHKAEPVIVKWQAPRLQLLEPRPTPVLFNPKAFAVSKEVRAALAHFPEVEFLPIEIAGFGTFFIMHVVAAVMAPECCSLRRSPVSKNIVQLYGFPPTYTPSADLFRVAQPDDSAAGRTGFCVSPIYASARGAQSVVAACRGYLRAVNVGR